MDSLSDVLDEPVTERTKVISNQLVNAKSSKSRWTAELEQFLREQWAKQLSASIISERIWLEKRVNFSRSAVIGKMHRMGFSEHPARKKRRLVRLSQQRKPRNHHKLNYQSAPDLFEQLIPRNLSDANKAFGPPTSIYELTHDTCNWPVGDPDKPGFTFCGAVPDFKHHYCSEHRALAYVPGSGRPFVPQRKSKFSINQKFESLT